MVLFALFLVKASGIFITQCIAKSRFAYVQLSTMNAFLQNPPSPSLELITVEPLFCGRFVRIYLKREWR